MCPCLLFMCQHGSQVGKPAQSLPPGSLHFNAGTNNPGGCILSSHQGPCTVLSALLHKPANSPNSATVHTLSAHFTDKESEAQIDEVTWSLPPS